MKIWRDYAHKILKPRSTQKPQSFWKIWKPINLHNLYNLLSGALRKPPSRAEFSKGTWFLRILSLYLLKNHILFGNVLWKVRFENGDLRKPPSRAEFSKGTWFLWRLSLNLLKKPHSFWKSALKSQIWKWWFEKTTLRSRNLKRNMVFEEIKIESTEKPHSFWKLALKSQIWKWWFEKTTLSTFTNFTSRNLKKNMYIKGSWRDYALKILKPRSTQKIKNHIHCGSHGRL